MVQTKKFRRYCFLVALETLARKAQNPNKRVEGSVGVVGGDHQNYQHSYHLMEQI